MLHRRLSLYLLPITIPTYHNLNRLGRNDSTPGQGPSRFIRPTTSLGPTPLDVLPYFLVVMSGSSVRRAAVVAPINSYASVASGQSRLPTLPTSDMHHNLSGSNRYNSATNTFGPKQSQSMTNLLPLPAYLRHTAYGERLSQHTKVQQAKTPSYNSISTPPSSLTLPGRVPPTHRSTTFEPIETLPAEDDSILSLPSRWDEQKKFQGIELPDALEAKFIGMG